MLPSLGNPSGRWGDRLSDSTADVLAGQRWDGLAAITAYQDLEVLMADLIQRSNTAMIQRLAWYNEQASVHPSQ